MTLIPALIGIVDDPDRLRSNRVANTVDPGNQDEPASATCVTEGGVAARNALPLNRRHCHTGLENNKGT